MVQDEYPLEACDFDGLLREVSEYLDVGVRLPVLPFKARGRVVLICEFDRTVGGDFGEVVASLAAVHRDDAVTVVVLDPDAGYYRTFYQCTPGFRLSRSSLAESYRSRMWHEPLGDPTGAIGHSANVFAIVGSSGAWALWAQRDWELGILMVPNPVGPWREVGIPFFDPQHDFDDLRAPAGWGMPLSDEVVAQFRSNIRELERPENGLR